MQAADFPLEVLHETFEECCVDVDVKDAQGGVLPGVTVTATSPAQIGMLTAVTNDAGIYRFPSVPPGAYKLQFELAGFQTNIRDGIRVTLGFNAQVNVALAVANVQETITVSGESPVIDTSATRIQTNYDQQSLASLPNARDMWSLLGRQGGVERHDRAEHVCRVPHRAVRIQLRAREQHRRRTLRRPGDQSGRRRRTRLVEQATA
jgi:hypothetical protein